MRSRPLARAASCQQPLVAEEFQWQWGNCILKLGLSAVLVAILTWSTCDPAQAANWKSSVTKEGRLVVSISGEITEGDLDAFKAAVKAANDAGKLVTSIRLNSIGGNLLEGGKIIRSCQVCEGRNQRWTRRDFRIGLLPDFRGRRNEIR